MVLQAELNKVEVQHRSLFVAGWKPFISYVGGIGLSIILIINPIMQYFGYDPVTVSLNALLELIIAMLGLGGVQVS